MGNYNPSLVKIANKTSRGTGATTLINGIPRAVLVRYLVNNASYYRTKNILDFGAGKKALQTAYLKSQGFKKITAYEFGENVVDGVHDKEALSRRYGVVFASNVLNVLASEDMLIQTLWEIKKACKPGGIVLLNYPASPRKLIIDGKKASSKKIAEYIFKVFKRIPERVAGTNVCPLWRIWKPE